MQLDEGLISLRQLKMMSPWKQIVLLSITGCLAGKILELGLSRRLSECIVAGDVTASSVLFLLCIFIRNDLGLNTLLLIIKSMNVQRRVLQDCTFATPQRAAGFVFLFTACPDHYQDPCKEFRPAS